MPDQLNCTGQKPASEILSGLAPQLISSAGYIKVKDTLQLDDDCLSNIYACGEVTDTNVPCPNARSAMRQANTVAKNVVRAINGKSPKHKYKHHWVDTFIKLTLGLVSESHSSKAEQLLTCNQDRSSTFMGDGKTELLFKGQDKDVTLMVHSVWTRMGQTPYDDAYVAVDNSDTKVDGASV